MNETESNISLFLIILMGIIINRLFRFYTLKKRRTYWFLIIRIFPFLLVFMTMIRMFLYSLFNVRLISEEFDKLMIIESGYVFLIGGIIFQVHFHKYLFRKTNENDNEQNSINTKSSINTKFTFISIRKAKGLINQLYWKSSRFIFKMKSIINQILFKSFNFNFPILKRYKKGIIAISIILLLITNPSPTIYGRYMNLLILSVYHAKAGDKELWCIGILGNFIKV